MQLLIFDLPTQIESIKTTQNDGRLRFNRLWPILLKPSRCITFYWLYWSTVVNNVNLHLTMSSPLKIFLTECTVVGNQRRQSSESWLQSANYSKSFPIRMDGEKTVDVYWLSINFAYFFSNSSVLSYFLSPAQPLNIHRLKYLCSSYVNCLI